LIDSDKLAFKEMLIAVYTIYSKPVPTKEILRLWWHKLEKFEFNVVGRAFDRWTDTPNKLPQPGEIKDMCKPREDVYKALSAPIDYESNKNHSTELIKIVKEGVKAPIDMRGWARLIKANPKNYPDISLRYAEEALA